MCPSRCEPDSTVAYRPALGQCQRSPLGVMTLWVGEALGLSTGVKAAASLGR